MDVRSRFVACETKRVSSIGAGDIAAVFSATPPLEIFRILMSLCMSWQPVDGEEFCLIFLDLSRAHPHCDVLREDLYVQLPPEAGYGPEYCALLHKLLYGLRDANQGFEFKVRDTFLGEGYEPGLHSPCCYRHP